MRFRILALLCLASAFCSCSKKPSPTALNPTHLQVTMRKFEIDPQVIRVKQGETVILDVSTKDVEHGFEVEDMGINEPIQPGKPVAIPLDTSKKGEFRVGCSIICGAGHEDMTAKIMVE
jgi:cytochrome c oxidase subunit 2